MRKLFAILLAVAMMATMSMTAFAAENPTTGLADNGFVTIDIGATYNAGGTASEVVSVDVAWGEMKFTYTAASQGEWDPQTHTYGRGTAAEWEAEGNDITVTNHSNTDIGAKFEYTSVVTTVSGAFSCDEDNWAENTLTLLTADNGSDGAAGTATSGTVTLKLSGSITADSDKVGTVTITIINK